MSIKYPTVQLEGSLELATAARGHRLRPAAISVPEGAVHASFDCECFGGPAAVVTVSAMGLLPCLQGRPTGKNRGTTCVHDSLALRFMCLVPLQPYIPAGLVRTIAFLCQKTGRRTGHLHMAYTGEDL